MQNTIKRVLVAAVWLLAPTMSTLAYDPIGNWFTAENRAQIRISPCGHEVLCGGIIRLKDPNDPKTRKPKTDVNNVDAGKRTQPLVGTRVVLDLKSTTTPNNWEGHVYNPDDGRTYTGFVTMSAPDFLKLKGCVLGGLICKSEVWRRAR
jgi:uncharacterized protein (DUF2147 family)